MARRKFAEFQWIDNDHMITEETDYMFLYILQNGLLMALRERGSLDQMQYESACEKLRGQRCDRARKLSHKNEDD